MGEDLYGVDEPGSVSELKWLSLDKNLKMARSRYLCMFDAQQYKEHWIYMN
jgi:hypothetical protein